MELNVNVRLYDNAANRRIHIRYCNVTLGRGKRDMHAGADGTVFCGPRFRVQMDVGSLE